MPKVQDKYFNCGLSEIFFSATILSKNARVPEGHFATVRWSHKRRNCPGNHIIKPLNFMHRVMNGETSTLLALEYVRRVEVFSQETVSAPGKISGKSGCYFLTLSVDFDMDFMEANRAKMANLQSTP